MIWPRFPHWGHGSSWHRGRDKDGVPSKICDRCLRPIGPLLAGEMITTGPAQQAAEVKGVPNVQAKRITRANVTPWKVSSR